MRKIFFLLFYVFSSVSAFSQNAGAWLLEEGKCWTVCVKYLSVSNPGTVDIVYREEMVSGDTIIDGIHFMRKFVKEYMGGEEAPEAWTKTNSFIGQEKSSIYYYDADRQEKEFVYMDLDFSRLPGEMMRVSLEGGTKLDYMVREVGDTILPGSQDLQIRKFMTVEYQEVIDPSLKVDEDDNDDPLCDIWVEGIGSLNNGISGMVNGLFGPPSGMRLVNCSVDSTVLYQFDGTVISNVDTKRQTEDCNEAVYSLNGMLSNGQSPKGIIIQSGRKRLSK